MKYRIIYIMKLESENHLFSEMNFDIFVLRSFMFPLRKFTLKSERICGRFSVFEQMLKLCDSLSESSSIMSVCLIKSKSSSVFQKCYCRDSQQRAPSALFSVCSPPCKTSQLLMVGMWFKWQTLNSHSCVCVCVCVCDDECDEGEADRMFNTMFKCLFT